MRRLVSDGLQLQYIFNFKAKRVLKYKDCPLLKYLVKVYS